MVKVKKGKKVESDDEMDVDTPSTREGTPSVQDDDVKGKSKKTKNEDGLTKKRGKKKKGDSESEEESLVSKTKGKLDESDEENDGGKKKKKPKGKKKIEENDEEISSVSKKIENVSLGRKEKKQTGKAVDSDEDEDQPPVPKTKKNQKPRGGFALLAVDDDNSDNEEPNSPIQSDSPEEIIEKPKQQEKQQKKGKKNRRKKDDNDEDDLDKVLAELELEYSGQKSKTDNNTIEEEPKVEETKKAKKKKKEQSEEKELAVEKTETKEEEEDVEESKSKGQKKKEKKRKGAQAQESNNSEISKTVASKEEENDENDDEEVEGGKKNKKDKKKKGKDDKDKDKGKGPGKKTIAAMQEALKKIKEEEEKQKQEEEERLKREEETEKAREEALRLEKERKEKKKQKEKDRKERLKAEGKLLTAKQKADKARAQAMIEALKAQGLEIPDPAEKKARRGTRIRPQKAKTQLSQESAESNDLKSEIIENKVEDDQLQEQPQQQEVEVEIVDTKEAEEEDGIKDAWDAESSEEDEASDKTKEETDKKKEVAEKRSSDEESESDGSEDDEDSDESSDEESGSDEDEHKTEAEKKRERALARIQKRREDAEKKRTLENLRAAVVCVLGHVDTGKTKILDKLRRTNVQDGEAGGITQQIGATNVPIENIKENARHVKGFSEMELKIPGLLIIDTPGHESFSNLRSRGSSLCDIAILVVDIMHGLEPQTIESINLLKQRKTPFIVALNKIDRLYDWQSMGRKDIRDVLESQADNTKREFKQRTNEAIVQFAEQGLNASLFYENPDIKSYVSLVPTSAITGEGMGNLLSLIVEFSQTLLAKRLMFSELLQATVLEVKAIPGLGTTIDVILINGTLHEGDTMIVAGTEQPIVTQIRSLLMPQPMKELRVKNAYVEYKEIKAAQGVKIAAKDLEKAIAGLNLLVAEKPDEVEIMSEEVAKELKSALSSIKLRERGVFVQASTLGSLEALLEFLRTSKIPYAGIRIGPVVKKDVMKASIMLEHEPQYATILAFDVKIEKDAQELADSLGVKVFQADIIYHLFDKFMAYREELRQKKREEFKNIAVFPCKLKVLPHYVFNSRDPIVMGVIVEAGVVKEGTPICVPSKEFLDLGIVTSVEVNHKQVEAARKGMEVCIKIENIPGETPKMFGRHFDEKDMLTSKISRQSIDACKEYFRDDLTKQDWALMVELKKTFQIL